MKAVKAALISCLGIVSLSILSFGQAHIDETRESVSYWVDAAKGSDTNPGTQQLPFQTVSVAATRAKDNNRSGIGTKIIVNPGTYRETVSFGANSQNTDFPITIQAATAGTAIISGADIFTGWSVYSGNSSMYTHSWPYRWGLCAADTGNHIEQDIVRRREMIFVNGTPLTQVLALTSTKPGTFYVDEGGGTVYIWPPSGTQINSATVEVATRANLLANTGMANMVVRGMVFQYANSCPIDQAVFFHNGASNILLDNNQMLWNNGEALSMQDTDFTVQNNVANHNGKGGFYDATVKNGLWTGNLAAYNNWRGAQGGYYTWGRAGFHFTGAHSETNTGSKAWFNQTYGLHWDTDNENVTVSSLIAAENHNANVFMEVTQGPLTFSSSYFCGGSPVTSSVAQGMTMRDSQYVTVSGSTFGNNVNGIVVTGPKGGADATNWETGQQYHLYTQNFTATGNTIVGGSAQQLFTDSPLTSEWAMFQTTLNSNNNTWWNAANASSFTVPTPKAGTLLDFSGWKSTTAQDSSSSFQSPGSHALDKCQVVADNSDYWYLADLGSITVKAGSSGVFTITMMPLGGFTGTANLTSDGLQKITGATGTWSKTSITTSGSVTFTVTSKTTTPKGTYPVVLIANSGNVTRTITVSVIVN
jgi:hypothetical protein